MIDEMTDDEFEEISELEDDPERLADEVERFLRSQDPEA
jgi:hypothetical protein